MISLQPLQDNRLPVSSWFSSLVGKCVSLFSPTSDYAAPTESTLETTAADHTKYLTLWFCLIALSAKLAQVDGALSFKEKQLVPRLFPVADKNPSSIISLFLDACADKVESIAYSYRIRYLFPDQPALYEDIMARFVQLALIDGPLHTREEHWLQKHLSIFQLDTGWFYTLIRSYLIPAHYDAYGILGIKEEASPAEIKKAYHQAMRRFHPDRLSSLSVSPFYATVAAEKCKLLTEAYQSLR